MKPAHIAIIISVAFLAFITFSANNTPPAKTLYKPTENATVEKTMRDQQAKLANECKNGHQSSCDAERLHTKMMNAAGIY